MEHCVARLAFLKGQHTRGSGSQGAGRQSIQHKFGASTRRVLRCDCHQEWTKALQMAVVFKKRIWAVQCLFLQTGRCPDATATAWRFRVRLVGHRRAGVSGAKLSALFNVAACQVVGPRDACFDIMSERAALHSRVFWSGCMVGLGNRSTVDHRHTDRQCLADLSSQSQARLHWSASPPYIWASSIESSWRRDVSMRRCSKGSDKIEVE